MCYGVWLCIEGPVTGIQWIYGNYVYVEILYTATITRSFIIWFFLSQMSGLKELWSLGHELEAYTSGNFIRYFSHKVSFTRTKYRVFLWPYHATTVGTVHLRLSRQFPGVNKRAIKEGQDGPLQALSSKSNLSELLTGWVTFFSDPFIRLFTFLGSHVLQVPTSCSWQC